MTDFHARPCLAPQNFTLVDATAANARTTEAARLGGVEKALPLAFRGGAVMGFTVAGLGLAGFAKENSVGNT